jgi:hypothetical protein
MPKRSNEFQKLVFAVKKAAGKDAIVKESEFLIDKVTGQKREVDVYIESVVAGHKVVVCVECVAEGRAASVTWVEEMMAKHQSLPTNCLVLASRKGFAKAARKKAEAAGIQILNYESLGQSAVDRLFGGASSLWSKVFALTPSKVVIRVAADASLNLPGEDVVVFPDQGLYTPEGTEGCTAQEFVQAALHREEFRKEFARQGDETHKWFELGFGPLVNQESKPMACLLKLSPRTLRPIDFVIISGACNFDITQFNLHHGKLGEVTVAWGTGSFLGKKRLLVASRVGGSMHAHNDEDPTAFVGYRNSMIYRLTPEELEKFAEAEELAELAKKSVQELVQDVLKKRSQPPADAVDLRERAAFGETSPVEETLHQKAATAFMSKAENRVYLRRQRRLAWAFMQQHELMRMAEKREKRSPQTATGFDRSRTR